jgi:hypothetical protein
MYLKLLKKKFASSVYSITVFTVIVQSSLFVTFVNVISMLNQFSHKCLRFTLCCTNGVLYRMFWLILRIWADDELPHEWNFRIICPILKKGDPMTCSNYRGILLLNTAYKILSYILCLPLRISSKNYRQITMRLSKREINHQPDFHLKSNYGKDSWISNWSTPSIYLL